MDNVILSFAKSLLEIVFIILGAFSPAFIGLALAYLLSGPSEWVRKKLYRPQNELLTSSAPKGRTLSILITYMLIMLLISATIYAFVVLILGTLPTDDLADTTKGIYEYFKDVEPINTWIEKKFSFASLAQMATSLVRGMVSFFVGIVASIYLLKDREFFISLWQKFLSLILSQRIHGHVNEIGAEIHQVLTTFLKGALVDGLIIALLSSIVLSALKIKLAVLIGILAGILNIIPYFGPFLGMVPGVLMAYISGGIFKCVIVIIALFLIQQLDSNYIYPKVVGSSIGLHPVFVLISVTVFGHFGGIIGMLLAVPAAGIIQVFIKKWAYSK